jgi:hypothetical protein
MEEQLNDLSAKSMKNNYLVNSQRQIQEMERKMGEMENKMEENKNYMKKKMDGMENKMDKKMDENKNEIKEEIQKSMKELQNSISSMNFHALDERLSKGNIKMKGTQENKGSILVEQLADNKKFSSGFNSNRRVNYDGGPKFNFPKIELKKFDGT